MTKAGWGVCAEGNGMMRLRVRCLFGELGVADDVLDVLLLLTAQFVVAPPDWTFVLAPKIQMSAGLARWFAFVALLAAQTTSEAA